MAEQDAGSGVVEERAGAPVQVEGTAPAAEGEAKAGPEVDPVSALRAEVAALRQEIDGLREQVAELADFRQKVTEVVTQTVESTAVEAVDKRLGATWAPRFSEILKLVQGLKDSSAKADAEVAEVRLHLPLLRRLALAGLEDLVARAERAAQVVREGVARLSAAPTGQPAGQPPKEDIL